MEINLRIRQEKDCANDKMIDKHDEQKEALQRNKNSRTDSNKFSHKFPKTFKSCCLDILTI